MFSGEKTQTPDDVLKALQKAGAPPPVPLRSEAYPMGLPGVSGLGKYKLDQANTL